MEHMGLLFPTCMGWRQSATREGRAPATGGYHIIMIIIITTIIIIAIPKTVHREPNKQDKNYWGVSGPSLPPMLEALLAGSGGAAPARWG